MTPERQPSSSDSPATPAFEISAQAESWVRRRDAGLTSAERQQLREWLSVDPRHADAFTRADRARTELDWPLHAGAVDEILEGLQQRRARRRALTSAGVLVAAVVALGLFIRPPAAHAPRESSSASTLVVVEPRRETLPDGSIVELNNGTEVSTDFSGIARLITLKRGIAHFVVAKDPARPFVVSAGGVAVHAVGTAFCVELDTKEVTVVVTAGRVSVSRATADASATPARAEAESLAVLDIGRAVVLPVDPPPAGLAPDIRTLLEAELSQRLAWRIPRLEFSGTPLAEVVATINRYNAQKFVLADPALEKLVLSGLLRADKGDALMDMLESEFGVEAERRGGEIILRKASRP